MIPLLKMLWPALIPLLLYTLWVFWRARKLEQGQDVPPLSRYRFWAILSSLLIAAIMLILIGFTQPANLAGHYRAATYKHGELQEGHFE